MIIENKLNSFPSVEELKKVKRRKLFKFKSMPSESDLSSVEVEFDVQFVFKHEEKLPQYEIENIADLELLEDSSESFTKEETLDLAYTAASMVKNNKSIKFSDAKQKESSRDLEKGLLNNNWFSVRVLKEGKLLGVCILTEVPLHPYLSIPTLHMSFMGISLETQDKQEHVKIKEILLNWVESKRTQNQILSGTIGSYNKSSLRLYHKLLGFKLEGGLFTRM